MVPHLQSKYSTWETGTHQEKRLNIYRECGAVQVECEDPHQLPRCLATGAAQLPQHDLILIIILPFVSSQEK